MLDKELISKLIRALLQHRRKRISVVCQCADHSSSYTTTIANTSTASVGQPVQKICLSAGIRADNSTYCTDSGPYGGIVGCGVTIVDGVEAVL